jgi:hypothetical protein
VSGCEKVCAFGFGVLQQFSEFYMPVAVHAGVRSASVFILGAEIVYYLLEVLAQVKNIQLDIQFVGDFFYVFGWVSRLLGCEHIYSAAVVTLLLK